MDSLAGWTPEAVVFDCDGLLVDSEPCWTVAETELFARYGLSFTMDYKAKLIGRSLPAAALVMAELFGEPQSSAARLETELFALVTEVVSAQAEAMPGAGELVAQIGNSVPVAVASNSPRALLDAALTRGGFTGVFPVSIAADEVSTPKPDPEMYHVACSRLGSNPERVLAFEDSMTGVASARAAGVRVVGVPTLKHDEFSADAVVASLIDPSLLRWVSEWSPAR